MKLLILRNISNILIFFGFIFIALMLFFYTIPRFSSVIIGDGGDNYQFLSFQYVGNLLLNQGQFPFGLTNYFRYPDGVNFQSIYDSSLLIILGILLYPFFKNPALVYNFSLIILIFLNLLISYISLRLFFSKPNAFAGSIIFGLSFYVVSRLGGHPNLLLTSSFLFIIYSSVRVFREHGSTKSLYLFFFSLLLQSFASLQYPLILISSLVLSMPVIYLFYPNNLKFFLSIVWSKRKKALIPIILVSLIFTLFHGQKLLGVITGELNLPGYEFVSINMEEFFLPNQYIPTIVSIFPNSNPKSIEGGLFIGYIEIILITLAVILLKPSRFKYFLLTMILIFFVISLGTQKFLPFIWPYQYLFNIFPFRGIVEPGRFIIITSIFYLFLVLMFLEKYKKPFVTTMVITLLLLERLPFNFPISEDLSDKKFVPVIRNSETSAVLDLPIFTDWWHGQIYDLLSVYYQKPIVNGYIHWSGNTQKSKYTINLLNDYSCSLYQDDKNTVQIKDTEKVKNLLKKYDIYTIVYHKNLADDNRCQVVKINIQTLFSNHEFQKIYEDNEVAAYNFNSRDMIFEERRNLSSSLCKVEKIEQHKPNTEKWQIANGENIVTATLWSNLPDKNSKERQVLIFPNDGEVTTVAGVGGSIQIRSNIPQCISGAKLDFEKNTTEKTSLNQLIEEGFIQIKQ